MHVARTQCTEATFSCLSSRRHDERERRKALVHFLCFLVTYFGRNSQRMGKGGCPSWLEDSLTSRGPWLLPTALYANMYIIN